jgi:hypothetical protein
VPASSASIQRRKRLGQFFSGLKVGRLLAALADAPNARSILDPMVGSGDLLQSCVDLGAQPSVMAGIEIDPAAHALARRRLPGTTMLCADAFSPETILKMPKLDWDLVIANPPFVRYQTASSQSGEMPSATLVRRNLLRSLEIIEDAGWSDTPIIRQAAAEYSGFADLGVPACLLSMALVRPGGRLALVLPQAWLSRDHAAPMRQCLDHLFETEFVVSDESATWFPDALVRTSLVVALRKQKTKRSARPFRIGLVGSDASHDSLVGSKHPGTSSPELFFARSVRSQRAVELASGRQAFGGMAGSADEARPITLSQLGVEVGQGLRTGANAFFYVRPLGTQEFQPSPEFGSQSVETPAETLRSVIRDQRDLETETWGERHAILDLRRFALPEDLEGLDSVGRGAYRPMSPALATHVRRAARTQSGKTGREKLIPDLTAVRTNVRPGRNDAPPRFWYMLPDFKPRHLPDVFMPRVCAGRPIAYLNNKRSLLIDANFITFRCAEQFPPEALVALLNTAWSWAALEKAGVVLGGGALKLEGAIIERLQFPVLDEGKIAALAAIGLKTPNLAKSEPWLEADAAIFGAGDPRIDETLSSAQKHLSTRNHQGLRRC